MKALQILSGVGDGALGEWVEAGDLATHLRRRLSAVEAARVNAVVDIRGRDEARQRYVAMLPYFPTAAVRVFAAQECALPWSDGR